MKIGNIKAQEILDSRENPTIKTTVYDGENISEASVPSGASTGENEAVELRDGDKNRYNGKGVLNAVENVEKKIAPLIIGMNPIQQKEVDLKIISADGTKNKSNFGANAILSVSMATCRAGATAKNISLYEHIAELAGTTELVLPVPSFNIINGGRHSKNELGIQEFMILPTGAKSFTEALQIGKEVYNSLENILRNKFGEEGVILGDEGGFAPPIKNGAEAFGLLEEAIENSGQVGKVEFGIDVAASEMYENGKYNLGFKSKENIFSKEELIELYRKFIREFNLISIEDPFDQNDWEAHTEFTKLVGNKIQVVGDDLLTTNFERIENAIEKKAVNALLLKINQVGSITESIESYKLAKKAGWNTMVSHRSGETMDDFIADLAVGLGARQIKSGAPSKPERLSKYNRLVKIEEELGKKSNYTGKNKT